MPRVLNDCVGCGEPYDVLTHEVCPSCRQTQAKLADRNKRLAAAGATTLTEDVTLTKRYLQIRGPGRDFIWTRSGAGNTAPTATEVAIQEQAHRASQTNQDRYNETLKRMEQMAQQGLQERGLAGISLDPAQKAFKAFIDQARARQLGVPIDSEATIAKARDMGIQVTTPIMYNDGDSQRSQP